MTLSTRIHLMVSSLVFGQEQPIFPAAPVESSSKDKDTKNRVRVILNII